MAVGQTDCMLLRALDGVRIVQDLRLVAALVIPRGHLECMESRISGMLRNGSACASAVSLCYAWLRCVW